MPREVVGPMRDLATMVASPEETTRLARAAIVDGKHVLTSLLEAKRVICLLAGR